MQTKFFTEFKNKFLVLLLAIVLLPCVFIFSACSKDNDPPKAGDPATINANTLQTQLNKLSSYTSNLSYEYTATMQDFENGVGGVAQSVSDSQTAPATVKVNGEDMVSIGSYEESTYYQYIIDGIMYDIHDDIDDEYDYAEFSASDASTSLAGNGAYGVLMELDTILSMLISSAQGTENYSLVYGENSDKIMTITGATANELNAVVDFFLANKDVNLATMINNLVEGLTGEEFDVVSVINAIKGMITADLTFADLIQSISLAANVDLMSMLPELETTINTFLTMPVEYDINESIAEERNYGNVWAGTVEGLPPIDLDTMIYANVLDVIGLEKADFDATVSEIITTYLTNEYVTLSALIQSQMENPEDFAMIEGMLQALNVERSNFIVTIEFNKNDAIKAIEVAFDGQIKLAMDEQNYSLYTIDASARMNLTNVGNTTIALPSNTTFDGGDLELRISYEDLVENNFTVINNNYSFLESFVYTETIGGVETNAISYNKNTKTFTFGSYIQDFVEDNGVNAFEYSIYNNGYYITVVLY